MNGFANAVSEHPKITENLDDNRIKALKSLALLLLHEVEQIEKSNHINGKCLTKNDVSLTDDVQNYEAELIRSALIQTKGHQTRAAQILGINGNTLSAKIKRFGIDPYNILEKFSASGE